MKKNRPESCALFRFPITTFVSVVLLLVTATVGAYAHSGRTVEATGKVVDGSGQPVIGAETAYRERARRILKFFINR